MPRYFFHVYNDDVTCDEEGVELPGIEAARAAGIKAARSLIAEHVKDGRVVLSDRIEIANEAGECELVVTFGDVLAITSTR